MRTRRTFQDVLKALAIEVDPMTAFACEYLEANGQKFLVHFGVQNAIEHAQELWLSRMEKQTGA